jgi:glucosamine--fructose-6-phosphate aminotransferase (isomerizing)
MCGLVGLVQRFDPHAKIDGAPVGEALAALDGWEATADDAAARLEQVASGLEALSLACVGWGGFRTLRADDALCKQVSDLSALLTTCADALDGRLAAARVGSSAEAEALARAALVARDVAWRLHQDALLNLGRAGAVVPPTVEPSEKGWFELWRLNLIMNQLGRLEVRGRDSGGLATLAVFSAEDWANLRGQLPAALQEDLVRRQAIRSLRQGAVLRVEGGDRVALAFAHKVAREVGELGANVSELRFQILSDPLWHAVVQHEGAQVQLMAHTRWASNGVISEPNCHPVANDVTGGPLERIVLAALNGDVDNYPALVGRWAVPADCTTDAKVIPLEVERQLGEHGGEPTDAVRAAAASFHGSTAIGVLASDDPGGVHLALRGSGQAIYVGLVPGGGALYASELYGVVELAPRFYKLDGEAGEVVRLSDDGSAPQVTTYAGEGRALGDAELKRAPIATRDIDRAGHAHYFEKEISEAPRSVERTLRGKYVLEDGQARFLLGDDVVPPAVREALASRTLRRLFVIGQGTAAVAGLSAADYLAQLLGPAGIEVRGMPATDLSGFCLDQLGPDALVVAVSQSGTTTDTNRTVDLARERGAHVIGIVNRRGSDLADKSHGVLYTSDGRDVEMSVASTKAFYCQVVAGYLLGLHLAQLAGSITPEDLAASLLRIGDLPRCLREVLDASRDRVRTAAQMALARSHWTVVGSGPLFQAAREIRIKLSELCYKSVSVDTIEDKKHIDLSSEPVILVCAAGLGGAAAADAVKEVAIFKAHAAIPVVICDRDETRFAEYAAASIPVPASTPEVALLLNTVAGHLFSYEVARAIDACAAPLKKGREVTEAALASLRDEADDPQAAQETLARARSALAPVAEQILGAVDEGRWTAAVSPRQAHRLVTALRAARGELLARATPKAPAELLEALHMELTHGLDALRRPIDAIKHQAKTVTVGISREASATRPEAGPLAQALVDVGAPAEAVADHHAAALASLEPAVDACLGAVRYRLDALSPLGAPTDATQIVAMAKSGVAAGLASRADQGAPLRGTKRALVRSPRVWVGHGQRDGRSLVLCPLFEGGLVAGLGLLHVRFKEALGRKERVRALRATGRYEDLKCAVTEWDVAWTDELLDDFSPEQLLTWSVERLAGALQDQGSAAPVSETAGGTP